MSDLALKAGVLKSATERLGVFAERRAIVVRLEATRRAWIPWSRTPWWKRPPFVLDEYFDALVAAGDFNRAHPEIAIPQDPPSH